MTVEYAQFPECGSRVSKDWGHCTECGAKHPLASEQTQFLTKNVNCPKCETTTLFLRNRSRFLLVSATRRHFYS
jgi:DNA-directed RNA polymerase subunit RPC12/RpoP